VVSNSATIPVSMIGSAAPVVVNAYHERSARRSERHGAPVVHVDVKMSDPAPERVDNDKGDWIVRLTIDADRLTPAQTAALSQPLPSQRVAPFAVTTTRVMTTMHRINYAASQFCDNDMMRCQEHIVYEDALVEATAVSLNDA
jgi:hypothetical protein